MIKFSYDTSTYKFREKICEIFSIDDLNNINEDIEVIRRENDQKTKYHKIYYDWTKTREFDNIYTSFITDIVLPIYDTPIVYQKIPTFRVAYQNNLAVGEFHKDKMYRDVDWAERICEDNFFLPFTDAFDTNTIWVETEEDKGDFFPMNCNYGEIIKWDGSNLTHGNKINTTGKTRVSVDFRVIPYDRYEPSNHGSINMDSKFRIGDYYNLIGI
jgi:hypothetical protein